MKKKYNQKGRNIPVQEDTTKKNKKQKRFEAFMQKELKKQHTREILKKFESVEKIDDGVLRSSKLFGKQKINDQIGITVVKDEYESSVEDYDDEIDDDFDNEMETEPQDDRGIVSRAFDSDKVQVVEVGYTPPEPSEIKKKKTRKRKRKNIVIEQLNVPSAVENTAGDQEPDTVESTQVEEMQEDTLENTTVEQHKVLEKAFHVPVNRTEEIQLARVSLPVVAEEQLIMETIHQNDVVILCGETGSGKTTQVPQFLYEAGYGDPNHPLYKGMVGITQPRRVAAVSMAKRVAQEMNLFDGQVTYQIRYDKAQTGANTRIKFMTDGILLKELGTGVQDDSASDLLLEKYSCIILDEAHERTVGTDILIGWLTRIVQLRNSGKVKSVGPLKLIIMSATLRVEDFTENKTLFPIPPPVLKVDGRQHKVIVHYNKRTPELDYLTEAFKKVCKIHTRLPPGGVLVFVTGQQEVQVLCRKLEQQFSSTKNMEKVQETTSGNRDMFDADYDDGNTDVVPTISDDFDNLDAMEQELDDEEQDVHVLNGTIEEDLEELKLNEKMDTKTPVHVLPLYSLLSTQDQMKVFQPPPEGARLIVVATNVAETSVTIPGIKYVVDCGKVKERRYDTQTGIEHFEIGWTSKASADQRAGRAGRTGPGHCYRIFSSSVYENFFSQFSKPEILRIPIDGVVLNMKSMGMKQIIGFPFPTPPDQERLSDAEKMLYHLGALGNDKKITKIGKIMAQFPVHPRYSRMLVACKKCPEVLPYIIAITAGLSVNDIFHRDADLLSEQPDEDMEHQEKEIRKQRRGQYFKKMAMFAGTNPTSDNLTILTAIGAYLNESQHPSKIEKFCKDHFLRSKAMDEVVKLMQQLTRLARVALEIPVQFQQRLLPPSSKQESLIKQILLTGYVDCVAMLDETQKYGKLQIPVYQTIWSTMKEQFIVHPSSALHRMRPAPKWVIYDQVQSKQQIMGPDGVVISLRESNDGFERKWIKGLTIIKDSWLTAHELTNRGCILEQPAPRYNPKSDKCLGFCSPTYGPKMWALPLTELELTKPVERACCFAQALLEGKVMIVPQPQHSIFTLLQAYLVSKPTMLMKAWARNQSRVQGLLDRLVSSGIFSRDDLLKIWQTDRLFLAKEYCQWLPLEFHKPITEKWPPVVYLNGSIKPNIKLVDALKEIMPK